MLRLHFAGPDGHALSLVFGNFTADHGATLIGTSRTVRATRDALQSREIDAVVFPLEWADIMRTLRLSANGSTSAPFILTTETPSKTGLVRALACGFEGAVSTMNGPLRTVGDIARIIDGSWTLQSEPLLRSLAITPGLLLRQLVVGNADDEQVADLVGTGLHDEDIAVVMDWSVQQVRNRIENLLAVNGLSYRTQLAVVRAASVKVPDFS